MKMFRWLAAGAVVVLLFALVFWKISPGPRTTKSEAPPPVQSVPVAVAAVKPAAPPVPSAPAPASVPAQEDALSVFEDWARNYAIASVDERPAMMAKGEEFARARRTEMAQLIRQDPRQALVRALPYSLRKQLPDSVLRLIEYPVSARGSFQPVCYNHALAQSHEAHAMGYEVVINKKRYQTHTYGDRLFQPRHDDMYLHGVALDDVNADATAPEANNLMALPEETARQLTDAMEIAESKPGPVCEICQQAPKPGRQPVVLQFGERFHTFCSAGHAGQFNQTLSEAHGRLWASKSHSTKEIIPTLDNDFGGFRPTDQGIFKLLYIRVTFADDPVPPQSDDGARGTVENNNRYYNEGSYGRVWWESTVTPVIRLPERKTFYGDFDGRYLGDARLGAAALGYFASDYFFTYVLCTDMPQFVFGGLSSGILNASPGALSHELGHNFGLPHGNFWQPEGRNPGPVQPRPPLPPYPIDPDSLIGHYDVNAPFNVKTNSGDPEPYQEYGNIHDVMGSGGGHFSAMFKNYMDWLPDSAIKTASGSTTNRIYAFDTPRTVDGRQYALRIRKDFQREYWFTYRQEISDNPWFSNGIEVDWNMGPRPLGFGSRIGNNLLIDTTPGTTFGRQDAAVVVGRTFRDTFADIYMTPVAIGGGPDPWDKWIDVVLQKGPFRDNQAPTMSLEASASAVNVGGTVTFSVTAQDADGDALAYHWDFGDHTFGSNSAVQTRTFDAAGQYVVRCEVSDTKGGLASVNVLVVVGSPGTFTMSGRVVDALGQPLQGVRVHNSGSKPGSPPSSPAGNPALGTYRFGYTDSQGYYIIGNVPAGTYTARAFAFGYRIEPLNFTDPVILQNGNANNINFNATPLTRVRIEQTTNAMEAGGDGAFTIRRQGDLSEDLPVRFDFTGTAIRDVDFTFTPGSYGTNLGEVVIPAGLESVDLFITPIDNASGGGDKSVFLTLLLQPTQTRISTVLTNRLITNGTVVVTNTELVTVTNVTRIPGWELRSSGPNSELTWFQTDPTYVIDTAEARLFITDDEPPNLPAVSISTLGSQAVETRNDNGTLLVRRSGAPLHEDLLVHYSVSGTAEEGVDYYPLSGQITIPAGHDYALLYITAINDLFVENAEFVQVAIEPSTNYNTLSGAASVTIVDDDLPLVNIFASDSTAARGGGPGRLTISRAGSLEEDLTISYVVTGTAVSGVDFAPLPGTAVIPAGQLSVDIPVAAIATSTTPLPRAVTIRIADSTVYNIYEQNSATVRIIDGALPTVTLATSSDTIAEAGGTASFIVTRSGPTDESLRVYFDVGGSAVEGFDYNAIGTNVVIPAGAASANIAITSVNDLARELGAIVGEETVIVQLRAGTNYHLGNPSGRTITFDDDESDTALPAVGFMLSTSMAREDVGTAILYVKVSANPATNRPIQVEYRVVGGSAVPNVNYVNAFPEGTNGNLGTTGLLDIAHINIRPPPPGFLGLLDEGGIYAVPVQIINDGVSSGNKTLTISLFNPTRYQTNFSSFTNMGNVFTNVVITRIPTNAYLGPSVTHTLTILDVGTAGVSVVASTNILLEDGPTESFTIMRDGPTNAPLTVAFAMNGTAANGSDYVLNATNSVTIPAGAHSAVVSVTAINDPAEEGVETLTLSILSRPGYQTFGGSSTMFLVSNDGTLQFSLSSYDVIEDASVVTVPVIRSGPTNLAVSVDYVFSDGSALNTNDFLGMNGTISFAPGETVQLIGFSIVEDSLVETNEVFSLSLTNATGGVQLGGQRNTLVRIIDDDREFNFAAGTFRSPEIGGIGEVVITRNGATNELDTVTFTATNGVADAADFVPTNIVVEFMPGETNRSVFIAFLDDDLFEGDEGIALTLSDPSAGSQLGPVSSATLLIADDECRLDFEVTGFSGREHSNFVSVIVRRTGGTVNSVTVDYVTADVTATNGLDYVGGTGMITFEGDRFVADTNGPGGLIFVPGDVVQVLNIPILDDVVGEGNETFTVTLSNPAGPSLFPGSTLLGSNVTAVVTILDNELPGNVDYEFVSGPNGPVRAVAIAPRGGLEEFEGRVVIGGEFTQVDGIVRNRIARLLPSGQLDTAFNPGDGANGIVYAVAVQPDGRVLAGGDFMTIDNTNRTRLARLNADGHVDAGFNIGGSGVNGIVRAIAVQTNGQILIGGDFSAVNGTNRAALARLHANGGLDSAFSTTVSGSVFAIAIQPDGKIVIGGSFSQVNGVARSGIARLNTDGSVDGGFTIGSGFLGAVHALALQADGSVLAGGTFTAYNGAGLARFVARLGSGGALDTTFNAEGSGPNDAVSSIGIATGNKIVIGGGFTTFNGLPRNRFARLLGSGALDGTFRIGTGANAPVRALVVQADSAAVIAGDFTIVDGLPRSYIARIHGDERFEVLGVEFSSPTYSIQEDGVSATITVQRIGNTNASFTVDFATANGTATAPGDYVSTNGTLSFAPGQLTETFSVGVFNDALIEGNETIVLSLANAPAGIDLSGLTTATLLIVDSARTVSLATNSWTFAESATNAEITIVRGGDLSGDVTVQFSTLNWVAAAGYDYVGTTNIVALTNGQESATVLVPIIDDTVQEFAENFYVQLTVPATAFLVGPTSAVVTLIDNDLSAGFPDTTFEPGAGAGRFVRALALQPNGRLVVGGAFTNFANSNLNFLARLHTNGAVDTTFTPGTGPNALVSGIAVSPSGHIAAGGAFSNYNGVPFNRLVRLTSNGVPDATFNQPMAFDAALNSVVAQSDGKIIAGGGFKTPVPAFARIRVNATLDLQFDSGNGADAAVNAIALQSDGKVLIGGAFTNVGGVITPRLARLGSNGVVDATFAPVTIPTGIVFAVSVAPDDKVVIGGNFRSINGSPRSGVARLNGDGTLDNTFDPGTGVTGTVYTVCTLVDGSVFIGGDFTTVNGVQRRRYALLRPNGAVDLRFDSSIGADNTVFASLVTPERKIYIGGDFTTVGGLPRRGVARVNLAEPSVITVFGPRIVSNAAELKVTTVPGDAYVLEGSSNLLYWISLSTNVATSALLDFTDPNVPGHGQRFYRARRFGP